MHSIDLSDEAENKEEQEMPYKSMDDWKYYLATLVLFTLQMVAGVYCEDIGNIFSFLSAICVSSIAFVWPGVFYLIAKDRFGNQATKGIEYSAENDQKLTAWMFIIFGVIAFAV